MTMIHEHKFTSNGNGSVTAGTGRTAWQVIEEACDLRVTGELALTTASPAKTKVYLMNGLVYFAETDTDESLANRLVLVGALDQQQLKNGMLKINGVENLGRLFDRDSSIDRDAVEVAIESITEQTLAETADQPVQSFRTTMYRHHSSGIHRWYSSQLSSDAEASSMAPMVTIVPVTERTTTEVVDQTSPIAMPVVADPVVDMPVVAEPVVEMPVVDMPVVAEPEPAVAEAVPPADVVPLATLTPMNGLVSLTAITPDQPDQPRVADAPFVRTPPQMVELATLLAHPSVPVPDPLLVEPEPETHEPEAYAPAAHEWFEPAPEPSPAPESIQPVEIVADAPADAPADNATDAVDRADVWAELWAAADKSPADLYGIVDTVDIVTATPTAAVASSPWDPPTLGAAMPEPVEMLEPVDVIEPVEAAPVDVIEPVEAAPVDVIEPVEMIEAPVPTLPFFNTPPATKISAQSSTPRAVLANAAPTFVLDANGPRLPEPGASVEAPQPEVLPVAVAQPPSANALDAWSTSSDWAQDLANEIAGAAPTLQSLAPMLPSTTTATPLAPTAPVAAPAPPAPTTTIAAPSSAAIPAAAPRIEPTPAPDHLIPQLGATPVPEDVAAAVRRAIAAIEAATLGSGAAAVTFGPMHVSAPAPAPAPAAAPTLVAQPITLPGGQPMLAPALGRPVPAASLLTLETTPTGPTGIEAVQNGQGIVTPLLSLTAPMSKPLTGTDFTPPLTSLGGTAGPHLPELPANPAGPPLGVERRSALRRLVDNIRGR